MFYLFNLILALQGCVFTYQPTLRVPSPCEAGQVADRRREAAEDSGYRKRITYALQPDAAGARSPQIGYFRAFVRTYPHRASTGQVCILLINVWRPLINAIQSGIIQCYNLDLAG